MGKLTCTVCNSEYEITEHKMINREKDNLLCEICDSEIKSWNGAVSFSSELIKAGFRNATLNSGTTLYKKSDFDAINTNVLIVPGNCEVISPLVNLNLIANDLLPISGIKSFYKVKIGSNEGYVLAHLIDFL